MMTGDPDTPRLDQLRFPGPLNLGEVEIPALPTQCEPHIYAELMSGQPPDDRIWLKLLDQRICWIRELRHAVSGLSRYYYRDPSHPSGVDFLSMSRVRKDAAEVMERAHETLMVYRSILLRKMGVLDEDQAALEKQYLPREKTL